MTLAEKKLSELEKIIVKQDKLISTLLKRLTLMERENTRRKSEINQLASQLERYVNK